MSDDRDKTRRVHGRRLPNGDVQPVAGYLFDGEGKPIKVRKEMAEASKARADRFDKIVGEFDIPAEKVDAFREVLFQSGFFRIAEGEQEALDAAHDDLVEVAKTAREMRDTIDSEPNLTLLARTLSLPGTYSAQASLWRWQLWYSPSQPTVSNTDMTLSCFAFRCPIRSPIHPHHHAR
jgi:hypothetical protein